MAGTINLTKVGFSQMNENLNLIVEENSDLRRLNINNLRVNETVGIDLQGSNEGEINPVNADTLGGVHAEEYIKEDELVNRVICGKGKNLWPYGDITAGTRSGLRLMIPAGKFVFSRKTTNCQITFRFFTSPDLSNTDESFTVTTNIAHKVIETQKAIYGCNYVATAYEGDTDTNIQIEVGETATEYEPYYEGLKDAISKDKVVNNFTTTEEGYVADARALKILNDKFNIDLLWENASPTSSFSSQSITIPMEQYNLFILHFKLCDSYDKYATEICLKGKCGWISAAMGSAGVAGARSTMVWRESNFTSDGTVYFGTGMRLGSTIETPLEANDWAVPYKIYGVKGGYGT